MLTEILSPLPSPARVILAAPKPVPLPPLPVPLPPPPPAPPVPSPVLIELTPPPSVSGVWRLAPRVAPRGFAHPYVLAVLAGAIAGGYIGLALDKQFDWAPFDFWGDLACDLVDCDEPDPDDFSDTDIVSSLDPNDIIGPAGFGPEGFLPPGGILPYIIRFENLRSATAPAQTATITHQLDPDLDFSTFELGDFGFGDQVVTVGEGHSFLTRLIDLRDQLGVFLDVTADFDSATGLLTWSFTSVDPVTFDLPLDPGVGFLPPNQTPPQGEGFVSYRVRPKEGLATGTRLDAQATIVFDVNPPLDTPAILNTIDAGAPASGVGALPAVTTSESFSVSWSGADDGDGTPGSGIASFDVFVSTDGGPFEPLLLGTTDTSAVFNGEFGHSYAFYSVARDNVGHAEAPPQMADTSTELAMCGDLNHDLAVSIADVVISLQIAVGLLTPGPVQAFIGDLTQDTNITVADVIVGLQHILGLVPDLERCGPL